MKILVIVFRILIGLILILSSTVKGVDPMGTVIKTGEWLKALHLGFLGFASYFIAIALIAAEYVTACAILLGVKMRFFSKLAIYLMGFFTLVTLYAAIFDPVSDCGCFGDAIPMSNVQSLLKNIVLLIGAFHIFLFYRYSKSDQYRELNVRWQKIRALGGKRTELSIVILYLLIILTVSLRSLSSTPPAEWGPYKAGTDLLFANNAESEGNTYETEQTDSVQSQMYLYTKDGLTQAFSLDNLPDTTWTFVDIAPDQTGGFAKDLIESIVRFETKAPPVLPIRNLGGFYVSSAILSSTTDIVFISIPQINSISERDAVRLVKLANEIYDRTPYTCYILCAASADQIRDKFKNRLFGKVLIGDYKSLLSLNRSNAGVSILHSGVIIAKYGSALRPAPFGLSHRRLMHVLAQDPDDVEIRSLSRSAAFIQLFFVGTLLTIYLLRVFLRRKKIVILENNKEDGDKEGENSFEKTE